MAAAIVNEISEFLQKGRAKNVKALVEQALAEGVDPKEILDEGLLAGMMIVGGKFKRNEVFVPEVLVAARAMNAGLTVSLRKLYVSINSSSVSPGNPTMTSIPKNTFGPPGTSVRSLMY